MMNAHPRRIKGLFFSHHFVRPDHFPASFVLHRALGHPYSLSLIFIIAMNSIMEKTIVDTIEAASDELRRISLEVKYKVWVCIHVCVHRLTCCYLA